MKELHRVLNMPECGWICLNRSLISLNMSEFTIIDSVLNMFHPIHNARSHYKLVNTYWEMGLLKTLSMILKNRFGKIIIVFNFFAFNYFQGRRGFVELEHFDKQAEKAPWKNILKFFLLDTLKTTFGMNIELKDGHH